MIYEIQTKSDISGIKFIVRFPEEDLDQKALYTIQAMPPDFVLPMHYHMVDGCVECIYEVGNRKKLQYSFGTRETREYAEFWQQLLRPLLDCGDWFMKPSSFVLDVRYLYADSSGKTVSYIYIPSRKDCGGPDVLRTMAVSIVGKNPAADPLLEKDVWKMVAQEFQPKVFLQMLAERARAQVRTAPCDDAPESGPRLKEPSFSDPSPLPSPLPSSDTPVEDDIHIKLADEQAGRGRFFHWGKGPQKSKKTTKDKKKGKEKKVQTLESMQTFSPPPVYEGSSGDETELDPALEGAHFRLTSGLPLPREIPVMIGPGDVFTIGRFDVSVGRKQSNFEFDPKTKAVSRRHAAIERHGEGGYVIVDLSSRAGTFVNGERLVANVPKKLENGDKVSFGTGGADYIWMC